MPNQPKGHQVTLIFELDGDRYESKTVSLKSPTPPAAILRRVPGQEPTIWLRAFHYSYVQIKSLFILKD